MSAFVRRSSALIAIIFVTIMGHPARGASADFLGTMFSFNGFGTVGVVHSSDDKADFTANYFQPRGAGYSSNWSPAVDSLIGAQLTANFTSRLSAVIQVISQQNYDNTYWPHIEWANIKYQVTPDFDVRVGRFVLPTFLVSDSRAVGYANPWVRPAAEVYGLNPLTYSDGVDASYRLHLGEVTNTLQGDYGRGLHFKFPADLGVGTATSSIDAKVAWSLFDTAEYGAALLHISYGHALITSNVATALFDGLREFGPQGNAIADQYELENKSETILTFGASYDPGRWFAMGEWAKERSASFLGESTGWYVSGGYRIKKFTPYVTYAQVTERFTSAPGLSLTGLPANVAPIAAELNAGLNEVIASRPIQYTYSAGVRWDFIKNFDLKLQFDRINLGAGNTGTLVNVQSGFVPGSTVYVFSTTVDFVF
jgi:hypothetical protein